MAQGITYFRLKSEYPGDITKNCGLTGVEVDSNFHFLEGKDVKSLTISDDGKDLVITLLDGTTVIGEGIMEAAKDELSFSFNPSTGVLTIIHNGEVQEVPGFNTGSGQSIVYTDDSLKGDGTPANPLGLSQQYSPGTKKAVLSVINGDTEQLPDNPGKGDRYLVKENRVVNGTLYNREGLDEIKNMLEDSRSEWRIPTVDDWNCLKEGLLECIAGKMIKANGKWPDGNTDDMYGFSAYPSGYSYEIGGDVIGFGHSAMFVTDSFDESGEMLCEMLDDGDNEITETEGDGFFSSLRFVKNYDGNNYHNYEVVLGESVRTCIVPACDGHYLVWTSENSSVATDSGSYIPEIYNDDKTLSCSICEWDGERWISSNLGDYESVFVIDQSRFLCRLGDTLYTSTEKWVIFE